MVQNALSVYVQFVNVSEYMRKPNIDSHYLGMISSVSELQVQITITTEE